MTGEQGPCVGMRRCIENCLHLARFHRLAGIDDAKVVAQLGDDAEIVGDEQQGDSELGDQLAQQKQDLVLRRDVEGCRGLVGDHQAWRTGQRGRDQQALALAARELVRIAFERGFRIRHLHALEQADQPRDMRPLARRTAQPFVGRVPAHDLEHLSADLEHRIERQQRILRNEADPAGTDAVVQLGFGEGQQVLALEPDLAGIDRRRARQDAHDRADQRGLPAARFAHHTQDAAALQGESDIVEDLGLALVGADRHLEAAHAEDRDHRDRRIRGSTMSRRPSPRRLKPITVIRIARPGKVAYHQARGR